MKRFKKFGGKGATFECSFFQNIIKKLMMFYLFDENQILGLLQIKEEKVDENNEEVWFQMELEYYNQFLYGKNHPFNGVKDLIAHFTQRIRLEKRIMDQIFPNNYIELKSKQYDVRDVLEEIYR